MAAELDVAARERLLDALAAGANNTQAAKVSGYSRRHVIRLLDDPAFGAELERRRATATGKNPDDELALATLREIAGSSEAEHKDRVAAAKALLAHGVAKRPKPKAQAEPAPAPLKLVDGSKAAAEWLEKQA